MHTTERGCALVLQRDLQYWGVDDMSMEPCCALKYFPELDVCQSEKDGDLDAKKRAVEQAEEEDFGNTQCAQWRAWVWSTIGNIKFLKLKMANQLHEYRVPLDLQACAVPGPVLSLHGDPVHDHLHHFHC